MANPFAQLRDLIHSLEDDFEKSYDKQNAAAGTRVRKGMQELKTMAQDIRLAVQTQKNSAKGAAGSAAPPASTGKKAAPAAKKAAPAAATKKSAPAKKK